MSEAKGCADHLIRPQFIEKEKMRSATEKGVSCVSQRNNGQEMDPALN